jgi:hypothetical protein
MSALSRLETELKNRNVDCNASTLTRMLSNGSIGLKHLREILTAPQHPRTVEVPDDETKQLVRGSDREWVGKSSEFVDIEPMSGDDATVLLTDAQQESKVRMGR